MYVVVNENLEYAQVVGGFIQRVPFQWAELFGDLDDAMDVARAARDQYRERFAVIEPNANNATVFVADFTDRTAATD